MHRGASVSRSGPNGRASAGRQATSNVLPPPSALIEILAVVGAIVAADRLLPDLGLLDLQPSLLWLPVLLASLHYGTVSGLLAAGLAIVSVVALGLPEAEVGENHFAYLLRIWAQPMLWIAAAVLLGQFRLRQITERSELGEELADLVRQRATLADHALALRGRCETLERSLASRSEHTGPELVSAVARVLDAGEDAADAACRAIALALPGVAASVFIEEEGVARRAASIGWPPDARHAPRLGAGHPLREAVVVGGRSVSVLDAEGERALAGEGLMAAPIVAGSGGVALGLVKIEQASGDAIRPETLEMLQAVALVLRVALDAAARRGVGDRVARDREGFARGRPGAGAVARLHPAAPAWQPAADLDVHMRAAGEGRDRG